MPASLKGILMAKNWLSVKVRCMASPARRTPRYVFLPGVLSVPRLRIQLNLLLLLRGIADFPHECGILCEINVFFFPDVCFGSWKESGRNMKSYLVAVLGFNTVLFH
jgi:hypothetical protein